MGDLKNHFGEDASVDKATAERISRYLGDNASDTEGLWPEVDTRRVIAEPTATDYRATQVN